jgi:hypothetical protein
MEKIGGKMNTHVSIPATTAALIDKARECEPVRLTKGQLVAKLVHEKYGHLGGDSGPTAQGFAAALVEKHGTAAKALKALPGTLPKTDGNYPEVQSILAGMI